MPTTQFILLVFAAIAIVSPKFRHAIWLFLVRLGAMALAELYGMGVKFGYLSKKRKIEAAIGWVIGLTAFAVAIFAAFGFRQSPETAMKISFIVILAGAGFFLYAGQQFTRKLAPCTFNGK